MTYNVFGGTFNLAQPQPQRMARLSNHDNGRRAVKSHSITGSEVLTSGMKMESVQPLDSLVIVKASQDHPQ